MRAFAIQTKHTIQLLMTINHKTSLIAFMLAARPYTHSGRF